MTGRTGQLTQENWDRIVIKDSCDRSFSTGLPVKVRLKVNEIVTQTVKEKLSHSHIIISMRSLSQMIKPNV
jgi:hypothetical protein